MSTVNVGMQHSDTQPSPWRWAGHAAVIELSFHVSESANMGICGGDQGTQRQRACSAVDGEVRACAIEKLRVHKFVCARVLDEGLLLLRDFNRFSAAATHRRPHDVPINPWSRCAWLVVLRQHAGRGGTTRPA